LSHDTWIHRAARIAIRPLLGTSVTPNHLTAARAVTGVVATVMLALATPTTLLAGTALFALSMLLDRADGELARATGKTSAWGHRFDLWTDAVCDTAALLALGIGQRDGAFGHWAVLMGVLAAACAAVIFHRVLDVDRRMGERNVVLPAFAGFDPDDAIIFIPIAMLVGLGDPALAAATLITPVAAILVYRFLDGLRCVAVAGKADSTPGRRPHRRRRR
jgi:phosphatidylglycerophosphate synthase